MKPEAEFKEFKPRPKFETWLKYSWFTLKLYSIFQGLSRRSIETDFLADLRRGSNSLNSDSERFIRSPISSAKMKMLHNARKENFLKL